MLRAFLVSLCGQLYFLFELARNVASPGWHRVIINAPLFLLIWLATLLLNLIHWVGFFFDEVFFRSYRKVEITRPIFVLGIPRSGTTFLHRKLAEDSRLTSLTTWQAVLAPSITERLIYRAIRKSLRHIGLSSRGKQITVERMEAIHSLGWNKPEEDFLLLWNLQACFLFVLLCPKSQHYWNLGSFDLRTSPWYRSTVLDYYQRCVQKHLYAEGEGKRFLSKNPSFTPFAMSLLGKFPDACLITCYRDPMVAVPSQLSSLKPALESLGYRSFPTSIKVPLIEKLQHYYLRVSELGQTGQALPVAQTSLRRNLTEVMQEIYAYVGLEAPNLEPERSSDQVPKASSSAAHSYSLEEFELSEVEIQQQFGHPWQEIKHFNNLS